MEDYTTYDAFSIYDKITSDYILQEFYSERDVYTTERRYALDSGFYSFLETIKSEHPNHILTSDVDAYYLYLKDYFVFIKASVSESIVSVSFHGRKEKTDPIIKTADDSMVYVVSDVNWVYDSEGRNITVPVNKKNLPIDEMYPFLGGKSLHEQYDEFMVSESNILLLIGPPGCGKTSYIRGLLHHTGQSATVTHDETVMERDSFFARFIESDKKVLVIEDADTILRSREDGNNLVSKFLNVGDGLVNSSHKKMIFSTNLPNINNVDPALIRPGRCFGIFHFDRYDTNQAEVVAKALGVDFSGEKGGKYTLAEVCDQRSPVISAAKTMNRGMGFFSS